MNRLLLFLLLLITGSAWAQAPTRLFYSQQSTTSSEDRIFSVNLANNVATSIANDASNFGQPNDLAFDPINNFIYVVDNIASSGPILRYTYDPVNNSVSGRTVIVEGTSGATYQGVAVDGFNGRLYFTQSSATSSLDALKVATGVNAATISAPLPATELVNGGAGTFTNLNDIVYDATNRQLYVADAVNQGGGILRYTLAATGLSVVGGATTIVGGNTVGGLTYTGLALDAANNRLYFTQSIAGSSSTMDDAVKYANLASTPSAVTSLITGNGSNFFVPSDLAIDLAGGYLYVADQGSSGFNSILRFRLDGTAATAQSTLTTVVPSSAAGSYSGLALSNGLPPTTINSITRAGTNPTNAGSVNYTVTFAASVTGLTTGNFSLTTTGTLGSTPSVSSVSGSGTTYTVTVNTGSGSGTLQLNLNSAIGLTPSVSNVPYTSGDAYTIDKTAPSAPVVTAPANGSFLATTPTYAGTAEANATVTVIVDGSSIGTTTANGSGNWTITQPTALAQGSHTVRATATDAAGNTSPSSSTNTFLIDTTRPSVAISSTAGSNGTTTSTSPVPFTITFSESVTGLVQGDLTVTSGSISGFSGSGSTYTFNVTPSGSGSTVSVNVGANVAQDAAGNGNTTSNTVSIQFVAPTITVAPASLPNGTQGTAYSVTFTASGGTSPYTYAITAGAVPAGMSLSSTGTLAGTPTANGTFNFTVMARDNSGAPGPYSGSRAYSFTIASAPSVTVTSVTRLTPSPTATPTVNYRVVFSGSVTGLTTSNFNLTTIGLSGTSVTSVSGSNNAYTVVVNTGSGDGTLRLNVANSTGISPSVSNTPYTTGEVYTITKSFAANPQLTIQGTGGTGSDVTAFVDVVQVLNGGVAFTNGLQNSSFEIHDPLANGDYGYQPTGASWTFNPQAGIAEENSAFTPITPIPNGIAVAFVQSNGGSNGQLQQNLAVPTGSSYQVSFRASQRLCCTTLDQALNVFLNGVFIGNIQPSSSSYDTFTSATFSVTAPALTAAISSSAGASGSTTNTSPIPFTVTFSQSVIGFTASDVTVGNGTLSGFAGSGTTYTFNVTPTATGTVTVNVPANVAVDASNTGNSAATQFSFTYEQLVTAAPVMLVPANGSLVSSPTPTYGGTAPAGAVIRVYVDGVLLPNTVTASSIGNWAITQPMALAQGSHTVRATAQLSGQVVSASSNTNTFTVDSVRPTVATSSTAGTSGSTTSALPIPMTVTFSEAVTGFAAGDVTVGNGSISGLAGSGTTYTFNVTPTANGTVTVSVPANVVQDVAGNFNTAAPQFSLIYQQAVTATPVVSTPANGSTVANTRPTYTGTAPANSAVAVYVDGVAVGTSTATGTGEFSLSQPTPLAPGSHTVYATALLSGQAVSAASNTNTFTINSAATYLSSTADQPNLERVQAGSTNQVILRVAVVVGGGTTAPLSAESFALTTTGSTSAADIAAARLYYTGTNNVFSPATPFGSAVATPNGTFTVAGAQQLTTGTNYFWLVYDVAPAATPRNVLDATITSLRISRAEYTPSVTAPAGNRQIIQVSPVAGNAVHFTGLGTAGYVNFSATPLPTLSTQYSQEVWVKPVLSGISGSTYYVLGNNTATTNTAAPFIAIGSAGRVFAGFGTGSTLFMNSTTSTPLNSVLSNTWSHIVATYDGSNLRIYVNGDLIAAVAAPANTVPVSTPVTYIGSAASSATTFFPGDIDEVSMWNRALSQAEIRQRHHLVRTGAEAGLVSYVQFNESTTTATDAISGVAGTFTGTGISRVSSTAPIGNGTSNLQSVTSASSYSFAGTNVAIDFTTIASTPYDVVVTRLEGTPLGTPVSDASLRNTHTRAYWIVDKYSTSNFAATITYTLDPGLVSASDAATPGVLKLYKRGSNSDGAFDAPISATAASATAGTVSFPVTSFSQTFIGTYGSSPLPVQLVHFKAEARGTSALLRWTTSQELNNDRFEVERSTNGRTFSTVGTVAGAGTSVAAHAYTFTDAQAGQVGKQVYYRLRQVDTNGKSSLSGVEVVQFAVAPGLVLWPNPSTDHLYLDLSSFSEATYTVLVMDGLGRTVLTTQVTPSAASAVSVAELPAGSYILHVLGDHTRTTRHFIKQK